MDHDPEGSHYKLGCLLLAVKEEVFRSKLCRRL